MSEHCTIGDIGLTLTGEDAPEVIDAVNEYLAVFAKPILIDVGRGVVRGKFACRSCGSPLGGLLGTFTWGISNGEGYCAKCGYPARAHHYPKIDGEDIFGGPIETVLQYLPPDDAAGQIRKGNTLCDQST